VQSSLYTDCDDPGTRSSRLCKSTVPMEANAGCLPGALMCMQAMVGCRQSEALDVWACGKEGKWKRRGCVAIVCLQRKSVLIAGFVPAVAAFGGVTDIRVHNYRPD
jgi:hypothetical protein